MTDTNGRHSPSREVIDIPIRADIALEVESWADHAGEELAAFVERILRQFLAGKERELGHEETARAWEDDE